MTEREQAAQLWQRLHAAGLVSSEMPPDLPREHNPWYLRVFQGLTGWLAALLLLGFFFALFHDFVRQEGWAAVLGSALVFSGYPGQKGLRSEFAAQFGLVLSLCGQVLWLLALHGWLDDTGAWLVAAVLEAGLAWLIPFGVHRFLSAYAATWFLALALSQWPVIWLLPAGLMAIVLVFWWRLLAGDSRTGLRPVAYAVTLALLQMHGLTLFPYNELLQAAYGHGLAQPTLVWIDEALPGLMLVLTIAGLLRRGQVALTSRLGALALAAGLVLALLSLRASGLAMAWVLILLGFASRQRVLMGLGLLAWSGYLVRYYYALELTLLAKSGLLMATGAILLLSRWGLTRLLPEDHHA